VKENKFQKKVNMMSNKQVNKNKTNKGNMPSCQSRQPLITAINGFLSEK